MKSFKEGIKAGEVKRADAMKVRIEDIHEEPGFNLRREGEDLEASIQALSDHVANGGMIPPLEVRPREEGGVYVVDGHRRRRALLRVADQLRTPDGELWVAVVAFTGNDADRVARIITSAESRGLTPLEIADGYRRLVAFGWSSEQIAAKVGKTRQHVDQLLILASAPAKVQAMVQAGEVAATTAIDQVRKHGDKAVEILTGAVGKAKAAGKGKATAGAVKGKPLPRKLVDELEPLVMRIADFLVDDDDHCITPDDAAELIEIVADMRVARRKQAAKAQADGVRDAQRDIEDDQGGE